MVFNIILQLEKGFQMTWEVKGLIFDTFLFHWVFFFVVMLKQMTIYFGNNEMKIQKLPSP